MKQSLTPRYNKSSLRILRRYISSLATLPETRSPVISAYFDCSRPMHELRTSFLEWAAEARNALPADRRSRFEQARRGIMDVFAQEWQDDVMSLAVFARGGAHPLLIVLPFQASLDNHFEVGARPVIFPLVQLKDRFHRFVLVICTEEISRIMEMTLGSVTEEILTSRPDLNHRIGRQLSREHFHHRREENLRRFMREQVHIINRLMERRGHNHLILAGHPRHIALLRKHLPKNLDSRVVGSLFKAPNGQDCSPLLNQAIDAFVEAEQKESRNTVERLHEQIRRHGLAVVGIYRCREVITAGAASELVISENLPAHDREELVRMAIMHDIPIEVCENDELLDEHGGVGCLLRYRLEYVGQKTAGQLTA